MSTRFVSTLSRNQATLTVSLKDHPSIKSLTEYFLSKINPNSALRAVLEDALTSSSSNHVGLILSERLVNMPVQVVPPMYKMLADEVKWAVEEVFVPLDLLPRNSPMARTNPSISSSTSL